MIIKICGIKNRDTLMCCENNNIGFFGMIFYTKSPRNISIENANKAINLGPSAKAYFVIAKAYLGIS